MAQQYGYTIVEGICFFFRKKNFKNFCFLDQHQQKRSDLTIDEHFRKSLGDNYNKFPGRCLTPDDSSSNCSSIERTSG